jgi:hypothetical protein
MNPLQINGLRMQSTQVREALNISAKRLPLNLEMTGTINGHHVWITKSHSDGSRGYSKNRTWTNCPICGKTVSCGTLNQHMLIKHGDVK